MRSDKFQLAPVGEVVSDAAHAVGGAADGGFKS